MLQLLEMDRLIQRKKGGISADLQGEEAKGFNSVLLRTTSSRRGIGSATVAVVVPRGKNKHGKPEVGKHTVNKKHPAADHGEEGSD